MTRVLKGPHSLTCTPPTDGELPWRGSGAYGLRGSCRFRFLGIQMGADY